MKMPIEVEELAEKASQATAAADPVQVFREVLELQRESSPELDVDEALAFAIANPDAEIVDSLGAVSVTCIFFGAFTPENLIPQHLLTHRNFSTLNGLRRVVAELTRRQDIR